MNAIFLAIVGVAFGIGAVRQIAWDGMGEAPMALLGKSMIDAAGGAVTLAIGLVGVMALFLEVGSAERDEVPFRVCPAN